MDNWFRRFLEKHPEAAILLLASVGTAFLMGTGLLRPVFKFGQKISGNRWGGNPAVPGNSATPGR